MESASLTLLTTPEFKASLVIEMCYMEASHMIKSRNLTNERQRPLLYFLAPRASTLERGREDGPSLELPCIIYKSA